MSKFRLRLVGALVAATVFAGAAPAYAAETGITLDEVVAVLKTGGFSPEVPADAKPNDAPEVSGTIARNSGTGIDFTLKLYDCSGTATQRCGKVMLFALFNDPEADTLSRYKEINDYNDSHLLGRAFSTGQAVGLDYVVFTDSSNAKAVFARRMQDFPGLVDDFLGSFK